MSVAQAKVVALKGDISNNWDDLVSAGEVEDIKGRAQFRRSAPKPRTGARIREDAHVYDHRDIIIPSTLPEVSSFEGDSQYERV